MATVSGGGRVLAPMNPARIAPPGGAPAQAGGYVPPLTPNPADDPRYRADPYGNVQRWNADGRWERYANPESNDSEASYAAGRRQNSALMDDARASGAEQMGRQREDSRRAEILRLVGPPPGVPSAPAAGPASPVVNAGADAAFAAAKDKAGILTRSGLTSLQSELEGRGIAGGGMEAGRTGLVLGGGMNALSDVVRGQAQQQAGRAYDVEDRNFAASEAERNRQIDIWRARVNMLSNLGY